MASDAGDDVIPLPQVTIHVARGRSSTTSREMKGRSLLLGSGPQCDIQMRSADIATKHALITRDQEGVMLRPLDAEHPVFVNGSPVGEQQLHHGDSVRLGPFELKVSIQHDRVSMPPAASTTGWQSLAKLARKSPDADSPAPFVPERLAEIQKAQADADKELERRRRQLQDELARIETERNQFKQEKGRFESHRQEVDRQLRESASREADLARLAEDLDDRQRKVVDAEHQIEVKRNILADQSIQFDRRLETYEARKLRLLRIRRRLIEQHRERRTQSIEIQTDVTQREEKLRIDRAEHEAEITHWKRVADELGRKQADLKRMEAEIQRRHEITERRETELRERQNRFEHEISQTQTKDRSLEALRSDLDRRKTLLTEEEASLREARRALEEQFERAKIRSGEIQRRHDEVEARRLTIEKQEQYLRDQATALEKHRVIMVELDRDLAARQAHLDQSESAVSATRQHLEAKEGDLRIRELALAQTQELLVSKEASLREWEGQKEIDQRAIDKRLADLQKESIEIAKQIEAEHQRIEDRKQESDRLYQASQRAKDEVEDERDRWLAKMNEAREMSAEVAHRESIVEARQRQVESVSQQHLRTTHQFVEDKQMLDNDRRLLELDRNKVQIESQESRDRARLIQAEVSRLRELSLELERRQQSLIERESRWSKEVHQRKSDWQQMLQEMSHRQEVLDRQAATQKQRVQKLRDLTAKLFGRSSRVDHKTEAMKDHHEHQVEQIQSAQFSQQELLQRLLAEVDSIDQQSAQSNESMAHLRAEQDRLIRVREEMTKSLDGSSFTGDKQVSLDQWSQEIADALDAMETRSQQIDARQEQLAKVEALLHPTPTTSTTNTPAKPNNILPVERSRSNPPTKPARQDPWPAILAKSDSDVFAAIELAQFVDSSKAAWLKQSAASRGCRLAQEVVRSRTATPYQLLRAIEGRAADLSLGSASVLDLLHEGGVATTYLVRTKSSDRLLAARMLKPIWSRDPARRRQYEIVLDSLRSFVHPNVVPTVGSMMAGERFGSLTEYVPSVALDELIGLPLPASALITILHQSLSAIAFAERGGIVHLALRPSRILLSPGGQVQILGFSEPDWLRRVHWCERGKHIQQFASPEVAHAGVVADSRADVYSIGSIASTMLLQSTGASSLADPALLEEYSPMILDLLRSLQDPSASARPRAHEAVDVLTESASPQSLIDWPDLAIRLEEYDRSYQDRMAA
ncbi:FHA domain-containing protein [bacterium]|nr:FHA domain-containing protein [bacterium]